MGAFGFRTGRQKPKLTPSTRPPPVTTPGQDKTAENDTTAVAQTPIESPGFHRMQEVNLPMSVKLSGVVRGVVGAIVSFVTAALAEVRDAAAILASACA